MSLDPGARYWGISVFSRGKIISSFVKNLSTNDSSRNRLLKVRATFLNLIKKHHPQVLILEKPPLSWKNLSPYLDHIIEEIRQLAKTTQIHVIEFTSQEIREALCKNKRATKAKIAQVLAKSYPEMMGFLIQDKMHRSEYWSRIVNSMALGICYARSQENIKISSKF